MAVALAVATTVVAVFGAAPSASAAGCRTAGNRGVLLGAHHEPAPYDGMSSFTELECAVGALDILHLYQAWDSTYAEYQPSWVDAASAGGRRVLITWEPWAPSGGVHQPGISPAAIARGDWDTYVTRYATAVRDHGAPVYLRPMHEMNGNWYPWAVGTNGVTAAQYVAAWRHLHDVFAQVGATNVQWVWSPDVVDISATNPFEAAYPGAAYVDVLGLDGYNWGADTPQNGGWQPFDQLFGSAYRRIGSLGSQPIWITEVGTTASGGDKAAWVRAMFDTRDFPRLEAIVWFDMDKERDWRMTSGQGVAAEFAFSLSTVQGETIVPVAATPPPTGTPGQAPPGRSTSVSNAQAAAADADLRIAAHPPFAGEGDTQPAPTSSEGPTVGRLPAGGGAASVLTASTPTHADDGRATSTQGPLLARSQPAQPMGPHAGTALAVSTPPPGAMGGLAILFGLLGAGGAAAGIAALNRRGRHRPRAHAHRHLP